MRIKKLAGLFTVGAAAVAAGVALATPSVGLQSQLLARGAVLDSGDRDDLASSLWASDGASDAAVVRATLEAGGATGWHRHQEGSMVILRSGTLTVKTALEHVGGGRNGTGQPGCVVETYDASTGGKAFFHTAGPHTFLNTGTTQAEFYVAYFAPRGAPLLIDEPVAPSSCN